ncbi:MAG TPA: hypothetical protein PKY82_31335, partial [Pyrinomonadaceae bacterium]|nr:hypothetical protein [Pyrinomonadaceae bacterium]
KSILEMTQFLGICRELMEDTAEIIQKDLKRFKDSEVLVSTFSNFTLNNIDRDASEIITELTFMSSSLGKVLKGAAITQSFKIEAKRVELTTQTIASLGSNGLLVGPPGTGKTWQVQRAVSLPTIQVSLEGSTEPETVVANIAQNQEGKFQAFLAETGKALKLGMLLAIVHCLRKKNALKDIFNSEIGTKSVILPNLPAALQNLLPKKQFESFSSDFIFLIENLHTVLLNGDESEIKQWLGLFDTYADPFALERWNEVLNLYQKLGANKVGTTVILSVEEIYHAVENRKILDLLINLMAGQKKLPLTKAGVVGGDLFGFNVSVWATGNPLRDAYLPEALSSRFSFQQFVGYPTAEEEKRRMALAREAITNPEEMKLNLISTELSDYWDLQPLAKPDLTKISANLRAKIYKIVQWTRIQFNSGNLRSCACPRMASFWEVLSCAFTAQQVPEKDAVSLAVEASVISLVDLDQNACPDNAQLINVRQFVESVMKD